MITKKLIAKALARTDNTHTVWGVLNDDGTIDPFYFPTSGEGEGEWDEYDPAYAAREYANDCGGIAVAVTMQPQVITPLAEEEEEFDD